MPQRSLRLDPDLWDTAAEVALAFRTDGFDDRRIEVDPNFSGDDPRLRPLDAVGADLFVVDEKRAGTTLAKTLAITRKMEAAGRPGRYGAALPVN